MKYVKLSFITNCVWWRLITENMNPILIHIYIHSRHPHANRRFHYSLIQGRCEIFSLSWVILFVKAYKNLAEQNMGTSRFSYELGRMSHKKRFWIQKLQDRFFVNTQWFSQFFYRHAMACITFYRYVGYLRRRIYNTLWFDWLERY